VAETADDCSMWVAQTLPSTNSGSAALKPWSMLVPPAGDRSRRRERVDVSSRGTGPTSSRVAGGAGPAARGGAEWPLVVARPQVDAAVAGDLRGGVRQGHLNDDYAGGRVEGCHDAGSLVVCFRRLADAATRCVVRPVPPAHLFPGHYAGGLCWSPAWAASKLTQNLSDDGACLLSTREG